MTSTAVVLGIATLGTPEASPECDCATDAAGSTAISKGIVNFIGYPFDSVRFDCWRRLARLLDICPRRRACDTITNDRCFFETGHKPASRGKEFNSERRRTGTSRPHDPL